MTMPKSFSTQVKTAINASASAQSYALLLMLLPLVSIIACIAECLMCSKSGKSKSHDSDHSGSDDNKSCHSDDGYKRTE